VIVALIKIKIAGIEPAVGGHNMTLRKSLITGVALSVIAIQSFAAVSTKEAARLNTDLTPVGAERAGNKAGTIPAWRGGITAPPLAYGKPGDFHVNPFPNDQPLFVISAENVDQYSDQLTDGQKALFKTYPESFRMPIYQTRRSASLPQWIYDNNANNAITATLSVGGNGVQNSYGGVPFAIPKTGQEVIWNHITRYRGIFFKRRTSEVAVQRNGDFSLVTTQQEAEFHYYNPKGSAESLDNMLFYYLSFTKAPARLAGGAVLVHETLDQVKEPRQAWGYNAGQRRVRRAPNLAYDTPIAAADGLRTADDTDMYNGAPDRYDWKLIGKKEIYIPYNNYEVASNKLSYEDVLQKGHINPDVTRYELHRVWVIEANLREGQRHIYSKRRFYIDEDSWSIAVADQFDGRGELWRVSMAYLKNFYELPSTWAAVDVFHDLQARRYHVQGLDNEENSTIDHGLEPPGKRYFKPSELRRRGRR
jgi:hypothetical protein